MRRDERALCALLSHVERPARSAHLDAALEKVDGIHAVEADFVALLRNLGRWEMDKWHRGGREQRPNMGPWRALGYERPTHQNLANLVEKFAVVQRLVALQPCLQGPTVECPVIPAK